MSKNVRKFRNLDSVTTYMLCIRIWDRMNTMVSNTNHSVSFLQLTIIQ